MNEEQEFLSWEECKEQIIKLGKFEFILKNSIRTSSKVYMKIFEKNNLIKDSVFYLTRDFPKTINYNERIYYILLDKKEYEFHYCPECKNELKFKTISSGYPIYCSYDCANTSELRTDKVKNTCMSKWGVEAPSQSPIIRDKQEKTTFSHYGVKNPFQSEEIKHKIIEYNLNNHGVRNAAQSEDAKNKSKETCIKNYGVDNPSKSPEIQNKKRQTCFERYGVYSTFIQPLIKKALILKYGVEYTIHIPGVIEKRKNTCIIKYGTKNPQLANGVQYSKVSQKLFDVIYENLPEELKSECYYATCKTDKKHQKEFVRYDKENDTSYFYDFTLSHLKFIIEFDGRYWHVDEKTKERDVQKQKFIENLGFTVLRIQEQDYYADKEKVISLCIEEILKKSNETKEYLENVPDTEIFEIVEGELA